jgi:hypothetical protein
VPGLRAERWHLRGGGRLTLEPPRDEGSSTYLQLPITGLCTRSAAQWLIGLLDATWTTDPFPASAAHRSQLLVRQPHRLVVADSQALRRLVLGDLIHQLGEIAGKHVTKGALVEFRLGYAGALCDRASCFDE